MEADHGTIFVYVPKVVGAGGDKDSQFETSKVWIKQKTPAQHPDIERQRSSLLSG